MPRWSDNERLEREMNEMERDMYSYSEPSRERGYVRNEYGHYDDPNNPTRTGYYYRPDGTKCYDM